VAIVDDDEVLGELLRHTLTTLGYSCVLLPDGAQAVDRLTGPGRTLRVKTVLLDIDLPGRNGFEVLRALQEHGVTAHSSVLIVSARSSPDEALRALRAGATDHIAKPFSVPLLVEKLHRLMADVR
jgi:Response regulators consisting of a CheY-like receiver domain and a winged-helix DNA-binding domain